MGAPVQVLANNSQAEYTDNFTAGLTISFSFKPQAGPSRTYPPHLYRNHQAQHRTIAFVEFLIDKAKLQDRLKGHLNERQEKALLGMLREGPEGLKGGLSAGKYCAITGASAATATRDLVDLVAKGALVRAGEGKHTRYHLGLPLRPVRGVILNQRGEPVES